MVIFSDLERLQLEVTGLQKSQIEDSREVFEFKRGTKDDFQR